MYNGRNTVVLTIVLALLITLLFWWAMNELIIPINWNGWVFSIMISFGISFFILGTALKAF